jgi:hypothetical protein
MRDATRVKALCKAGKPSERLTTVCAQPSRTKLPFWAICQTRGIRLEWRQAIDGLAEELFLIVATVSLPGLLPTPPVCSHFPKRPAVGPGADYQEFSPWVLSSLHRHRFSACRGHGRSFPVHRIYCVGRNYEGTCQNGVYRTRASLFSQTQMPSLRWTPAPGQRPHPSLTHSLHHEIRTGGGHWKGGKNILAADARLHFGYAVGLDAACKTR